MSDEIKPESDDIEILEGDCQEEPLKIKVKGIVRDYVIRELDGPGRKRWQRLVEAAMTLKRGIVTAIKDPVGLQHSLLVMTVFERETNTPVTAAEVSAWGSSIQITVFNKSRALSGLDKDAAETAKND